MDKKYGCADCGYKQNSMDRLCDNCNSARVVDIEFTESLIGIKWDDCFKKVIINDI